MRFEKNPVSQFKNCTRNVIIEEDSLDQLYAYLYCHWCFTYLSHFVLFSMIFIFLLMFLTLHLSRLLLVTSLRVTVDEIL